MRQSSRLNERPCPECKAPMVWEPTDYGGKIKNRVFDLYCFKCDSYYNSQPYKNIGKMSKRSGGRIRHERERGEFKAAIQPSEEQKKLEQELKTNRQQSIIPDKEFHDLFCKTLKEVTEKECTCYGKDIKLTQ